MDCLRWILSVLCEFFAELKWEQKWRCFMCSYSKKVRNIDFSDVLFYRCKMDFLNVGDKK